MHNTVLRKNYIKLERNIYRNNRNRQAYRNTASEKTTCENTKDC